MGKARYIWVTVIPLLFVGVTTLIAGYQSMTDNFYPLTQSGNPALASQGWVNIGLTVTIIVLALLIAGDTVWKSYQILKTP
jgi:carbon starvation protein